MAKDQTSPEGTHRKLKAASVSVGVNLTLIIIKIAAAILSGSIAILAEVFHSGLDLLASVFAYIGIRQASKPDDEDHHYGHEKFENLSSLIQTILIAITSFLIIYEASHRLRNPHPLEATWLALGIMALTLIADFLVARYLHKVSGETGSSALEADAYHFTTDLWSAIAVIVGLLFASLGYPVFDSIAAILVALLMLWISYHLATKSLNVMLDKGPTKQVVDEIGGLIRSTAGVRGFHLLRIRQSGNRLFADVNIHVDPEITVVEGHAIAHRVKQAIVEKHPEFKDISVHVEPERTDELRVKAKAKARPR
jgi:cation diffusion facilitator family transporter